MIPTRLLLAITLFLAIGTTCWAQPDPVDAVPSEEEWTEEDSAAADLIDRAQGRGEMSILDLLRKMKYFIYPFAAFSVWMIYLVLANLLIVSEARLVPLRIARQARDHLIEGNLGAVWGMVERRGDLISTMLRTGCTKAGRDAAIIENAMEGSVSGEIVRHRNRIRHLADIGNLAPMVGLLGTVWGMLKVFQAISFDSSNSMIGNWSSLLAEGVAQAMVTTVVGLVIGIPSLFFYYLYRNKLTRVIGRLEAIGTDLAELLSQARPSSATGIGSGEETR